MRRGVLATLAVRGYGEDNVRVRRGMSTIKIVDMYERFEALEATRNLFVSSSARGDEPAGVPW